MRLTLFLQSICQRALLLSTIQWLNEARKDEYEECDERGCEAVHAERTDEKDLHSGEVERCQDADERNALQDATQESVKKDEFESGKDEKYPVEQNAVFSERYTEKMRILAIDDNVAAGKILNVADERRACTFAFCKIRGVRNPAKSEDQYADHPNTFHTLKDTRLDDSVQIGRMPPSTPQQEESLLD